MKIVQTKFKGLCIVNGFSFYDRRGFFREIYKNSLFKKYKPVFWCVSKSKKNVLRGLHLQKKKSQAKFVSVLRGKILDVVVDLRKKSKTLVRLFYQFPLILIAIWHSQKTSNKIFSLLCISLFVPTIIYFLTLSI